MDGVWRRTRPWLALFDLDHTLLDGDSDVSGAQFLIEEGVLHPEEYHAKNMWFAERYKDGTLDIHEFLDFQLAPLAAHPRAKLEAWHRGFMQRKIRPIIRERAIELIAPRWRNGCAPPSPPCARP
jgi:phosphoserine phosphatase